jgi:hypothetical protein
MKDSIGNILKIGDQVLVQLPQPIVIGVIAEMREPGVISRVHSKTGDATPGVLVISAALPLPVDPNNVVGQVVRVHTPTQDASDTEKRALGPMKVQ